MSYRADFLWPHDDGTVEEAGYEFANGKDEQYVKMWWGILLERVQAESVSPVENVVEAIPWYEYCVLAPVDGVPETTDAVVADYRRWAGQPGNRIEVNGVQHTLGPIRIAPPTKAERYGRWWAVATWWPKGRG